MFKLSLQPENFLLTLSELGFDLWNVRLRVLQRFQGFVDVRILWLAMFIHNGLEEVLVRIGLGRCIVWRGRRLIVIKHGLVCHSVLPI
ncbi:hypothetical protein D3C87_1602110 [compost metagenome]